MLIFFSLVLLSPTEIPVVELDLSVKNGVVIRARETLRLPATVTGKPYPSITWTINDGKPDKDRVEILTEGNNSIVSIKNAQRKDCGKYHISACNPSGTKAASTRVEVVGEYRPKKSGPEVDGSLQILVQKNPKMNGAELFPFHLQMSLGRSQT